MNKLKLMGIQQWRLRPRAAAQAVSESVPEIAPEIVEAEVRIEPDTDPVAPIIAPAQESLSQADTVSESNPQPKISWESLDQAINSQSACQYCATEKPILGVGHQQADCVFIVAMPSVNDLQRQQLLSGRDGQLFDGMLRAMSLTREQIYLTSACKCVVTDGSVSTRPCIHLVHQQLALIQPKVIVTFGQQAAQWVIKSNENLPVLRVQAQKSHNSDIPVVVTHELSQLFAQPRLKAQAWQDLKYAISLLAAASTV